MSDIKKQLTLVASLDDSAFKQQLKQLKKDLGSDFSLGKQDLGEFRKELKSAAKEFASALKEALSGVKLSGSSGAMAVGGSSSKVNVSGYSSLIKNDRDKELAKKLETEARLESRKTQNQEKSFQKEERARKKLEERVANQKLKEEQRVQDQLQKLRDKESQKKDQDTAQRLEEEKRQEEERPKIFAKNMAKTGGAIGAATYGYLKISQAMAEREFRSVSDLNQGAALEDIARQSGRNEFLPKAGGAIAGALGGAATGAMVGSFLGPLGTLAGGVIGGAGGAIAGAIGASNLAGEVNVAKTKPIQEAFDRARGISPMRLQAMAGTNLGTTGINTLQTQGTRAGYGPEETLQAFMSAKGALGGKGASEAMDDLLRRQRYLGISAGTGAQAIEAFAGAGGTSRGSAQNAQSEIIKKGVAAGLDVSKSGKFLQSVSQYVADTAGIGRLNTDDIAQRVALSARGLAGGGDITDTAMQQALDIEQRSRAESMSTEGIAGVGNYVGVQQALGPNATTEQMMAALKLSKDAKLEDIQQVVGVDEETAKKLQQAKQNSLFSGFSALGLNTTTQQAAFSSFETGDASEQFLGRKRAAESIKAGFSNEEMLAGSKALAAPGASMQGTELDFAKASARRDSENVIAGIDKFDIGVQRLDKGLDDLYKALQKASSRIDSMADSMGINRTK